MFSFLRRSVYRIMPRSWAEVRIALATLRELVLLLLLLAGLLGSARGPEVPRHAGIAPSARLDAGPTARPGYGQAP
jgi:hypothetical protein